jgi:hypothetical protein
MNVSPSRFALILERSGVPGYRRPLSAQARAPGRPSGADKQKEPTENQGGIRPGLNGPRNDRAMNAARRHAQILVAGIQGGENGLNAP